MHRDFEITDGIYLVQGTYELDLHNCFDFNSLSYSVESRTLSLNWKRSDGDWVAVGTPNSVVVEFGDVSEFRFLPRDAELPFTEDDCVDTFGYWSDEEWAEGVILVGPEQDPDPKWPIAIEFRSGATIIVQATSACALIEP
ncbi:MAG: hypothetical protein ABL984_01965 [Pyrinomonadaceae bacterium]